MSDIDNEKPRRRKVSELVSDATEAMGDLLGDAPVVEQTPANLEMSPEQTSETTETVAANIEWNAETANLAFTDADGSESEAQMDASDAVVEQLSNDETVLDDVALDAATDTAEPASDFDDRFIATGGKPMADVSDRSERLQELARLVAKTVSERKADLGDIVGATHESESVEAEQMGFEALEDELDAADNDADPEPTEFVEADHLISIVESLLFSTDKPVSLATFKSLFKGTNVRTKDIARALDILASEYASATRGVTLEEINGGYQLRTKVDNTDFLKRLQKVRPFRLSGPALETMSIVAYKQPVTKYEIDEIRGVESGHLLRALMERGLVQFQGKAEDKPGKPMAYGSTKKFLETFGLRNLRELPTLSEIDELLPEGIGEVEEKEKLSDITDELSSEFAGGYSDNEEELGKINETLQAIDTTSEFFEQEKVRERERRDRDRAQDLRERLVLGEVVDSKDQRWLDRYEAKLHAIETQAASADGTPTTISADDIEATAPIGDALESLTTETGADHKKMAQSAKDDQNELDEIDSDGEHADDDLPEDVDTSDDV
jgi:segregation and condensation protein B